MSAYVYVCICACYMSPLSRSRVRPRCHCNSGTVYLHRKIRMRERVFSGTSTTHMHAACRIRMSIHSVNEARQLQARSARALWHCPKVTPKLELARPHAPLPADHDSPQGIRIQGGHAHSSSRSVRSKKADWGIRHYAG